MIDEKIYAERRKKINVLRAKTEKMTPRERCIKAINFEEPDRVPIDNWMVPEIKKRCMTYWGLENEAELLDFLGRPGQPRTRLCGQFRRMMAPEDRGVSAGR
jgi:hypothetical protein